MKLTDDKVASWLPKDWNKEKWYSDQKETYFQILQLAFDNESLPSVHICVRSLIYFFMDICFNQTDITQSPDQLLH